MALFAGFAPQKIFGFGGVLGDPFGRRGARPLNREEAEGLYLRGGQLYTVTDAPPSQPLAFGAPAATGTSATATLGNWLDRLRALVLVR